ncbi:MAG: LTA synthase family protein [Clostridia bacterium]|nr:LTA synthase family protein [Clostridia bacterium]
MFLLLGNILFFLTLWLLQKYDKICLDQCLFQIKTSSSGVNHEIAGSAVLRVGGLSIVSTAVQIFLYLLLSGRLAEKLVGHSSYIFYCTTNACGFFRRRALPLALAIFIFCTSFFAVQLDVLAYVDTVYTDSDFIEEHYADPHTVELTFPQNKRNLIYIFLESMENTYADTSAGEPITANYIPELTALAEENVSFSNTDTNGGAYSYSGTTWTASAMVAQTSGLPVKVPLGADAYGDEEGFMPGVTSLGEILANKGYNQTLLVGSEAEFHGRESYFVGHGDYKIVDIISLKEDGILPEDYYEWWGFEDEKLFEFAKEELTALAAKEEPFNLTMLTADTHFPDGYVCEKCGAEHAEQYANVLSCSSKQVYDFIEWVKQQPFYENTTIVISGDHLTMDANFLDDIDENYTRTVYNCIVNSAVEPVNEKNREFGTFDMLPTTLAAMGVKIEGDRLALGTNLFSAEQTLTEIYGFEVLDIEMQKNSEFYNTNFLAMEE